MTPSELADRLEQMKNEGIAAIASDDIATAQMVNIEMVPLVWQQCEVITKSLHFTEDMGKLMESDDREIVFRRLSGGRIQLSTSWREDGELKIFSRVFFDSDIYSAAHKVVEALEGKQ